MTVEIIKPEAVAHLFENWDETMVWSCLDGTMGCVYGIEGNNDSALCVLGDFGFLAGKPSRELVEFWPGSLLNRAVLTAYDEEWKQLMEEVYGQYTEKRIRHAFRKDTVFDNEKLNVLQMWKVMNSER